MYHDQPVSVAIIADTHGSLDKRITDLVASCDMVVHAGDIGSAEVLRNLRPRRDEIIAVRGNNDVPEKWSAEDHDVLELLPTETFVDLPGGRLVVVHGHKSGSALAARHANLRERYRDAHAIVCGHSHQMFADQEQMPWILNPGSAGMRRNNGGPSCFVLLAGVAQWSVQHRKFER